MYKVKTIKLKLFLVGIFIIGIVSFPSLSFSEMQIEVQGDEINVETIPNNPEPYQNVTINLTSYATDLNKAVIVWQADSRTLLSGIGKTSYSFTTKGPDTTNIFDVTITPVGAMSVINKKIAIYPSEVEVLWESLNGYTPPFYKGKTLPTRGSMIKVIATPNTNTIKSGMGSISYTWKNGSDTKLDSSGYNKNSYVFKNGLFDSVNEIKVTASSVSGNYGAEKSIKIPMYNPKIVFYKKSPTEGINYNTALDNNFAMTDDEMTIVAIPYFLAIKDNEDKFNYNWTINGDPINTPLNKTVLTIRPTSRGGYANISLVLENINELFQSVTGQLKLTL